MLGKLLPNGQQNGSVDRSAVILSSLICGVNAFMNPVSKYNITIGNHRANWKLGQDKTRRIARLDKAVSTFSVADSLDLSPIQFTQFCQCRRCELAVRILDIAQHN